MATESPTKYRHPQHSKLWMFKRPNSSSWWCGFHHQGKYHRQSTRTDLQSEAERIAADWYLDKQVEIRTGVIPTKQPKRDIHTIKDAAVIAENHLRTLVERGDKSPRYLKTVLGYLGRHIFPYFGDMDVQTIDSKTWAQYIQHLYKERPKIANNTVHQIRNALSICMKAAADEGWIDEAPRLRLENKTNLPTKRVWFEPDEQKLLLKALDEYVEEKRGKRREQDAEELRDYVKFILYSGLRKGEAMSLRFCDVREYIDHKGLPHILLNVEGKRGEGMCNPDRDILPVYKSIKKRRNPQSQTEALFVAYHHEAFNAILRKAGLKFDSRGRKRDFISLRHTYISNKIREGVPIFDIARNCRTSTTMIDNHYAKHITPELLKSLHQSSDKEIDAMLERQRQLELMKKEMVEKVRELAAFISISEQELNKRFPDGVEGEQVSIPFKMPVSEKERKMAEEIAAIMKKYGINEDK